MKNNLKYVQIVGTQRSGSNLLRVMLNQHKEITAPHPPHILQKFIPVAGLYGNLERDDNFRQLIEDICRYVELNPVEWNGLELDRDAIFSAARKRSVFEVFRLIYEMYAQSKNTSIWCCKSMSNIYVADDLENHGLKPLYIYLYRDGRDVALSFKKAIVGEKHIYHLAKKWKSDQEEALSFLKNIDDSRKVFIKYEDFIAGPEKFLKQICEKLNISYSPEMLAYYNSEESKNTAGAGEMWANVQKPLMKNNTKKYSRFLSEQDIRLFEMVAKDTLKALGYMPDFYRNGQKFDIPGEQIAEFDIQNEQLKREAVMRTKESDIQKRKPQEELLRKIVIRQKEKNLILT